MNRLYTHQMVHQQIICDALDGHSQVQVQNAMMRMADMDLALALNLLEPELRMELLSGIARGKADRVEQNIDRLRRVQVRDDQKLRAVQCFLTSLDGKAPVLSPYFRPRSGQR